MGNIHDVLREELPSGMIVGKHYVVGVLTYNGRSQSRQIYAETEDELLEQAKACKRRIIDDCGQAARWIFPDDALWKLEIRA